MIIKDPHTGRKLVSILGTGELVVHAKDAVQACAVEYRALVRYLVRLPRKRAYNENDMGARAESKMRVEVAALEKENAEMMSAICGQNERIEALQAKLLNAEAKLLKHEIPF